MKSLLALILLFSLSAIATPLSQEQLDRVNAFIATQVSATGSTTSVMVTSAQTDDSTGLLTEIFVQGRDPIAYPNGLVTLTLSAADDVIQLGVELRGNTNELGATYETVVNAYIFLLQDFVNYINGNGRYIATLDLVSDSVQTSVKMTLVPSTTNTDTLLIQALIAGDLKSDGTAVATATASFNAQDTMVQTLQASLSNIIGKLGNGEQPDSMDIMAIEAIIQALFTPSETP